MYINGGSAIHDNDNDIIGNGNDNEYVVNISKTERAWRLYVIIDDAVRFLDKDRYMYTCAWMCETTKLVLDLI
jgi:hypothetical protein